MTAITHMLGWGAGHQWWTILLACGHKRRHIRNGDVEREQLFIGKLVPCADYVRGMKRDVEER
jgi:hypothetical protein